MYKLVDQNGNTYESAAPGTLGGHRKLKIYGRLDCPSAKRYLAKGQYAQYRVFFADEETAIAAGYRPCGVCMKDAYRKWKAAGGKNAVVRYRPETKPPHSSTGENRP